MQSKSPPKKAPRRSPAGGVRAGSSQLEAVDTAAKLWIRAVKAEKTFGPWAFLEITDPWEAQGTLRSFLQRRGKRD